ncbi:hypothetical protein UFOVP1131_76 [uncultured Caudovirales phage]|uniref:Major tropism determinant N-terminal domain-containing protein n=1 Tax=uncultured Caudovirales phage TaxID=2100421 RepID=A0A6J5QME6_9CAUD|nr:hypothetical protein UFOVP966_90 [uncultured Caudovirales phage]CAB4184962.1 hypothetical protein UFOVP1131_76 [uncultured Caudovirales phage]CAB4192873.1 hypothetical protein UFOVP1245_110 [uncultured Caudovirales phage]CAB5231348.1 hypothetical protein UFOVP1582_68 [uncultured Caudovirales phage]
MANIIKPRRDTAANWASVNPTLAAGEIGYDSTNKQFKIGTGSTAWTSLPFSTESPDGAQAKADTAESDAISSAASDATTKVSTHAGLTATHGVSGAIVGTTNTQTLTGKTIDGNSNTLTVLNAQTTATSANTASAIVLRDAQGSFSAGKITIETPTAALHAATKGYVDNVTAGINTHGSAFAATTANLSATYTNGTSDQSNGTGIGATLTATSNGAISIDGQSPTSGARILVKDQTSALQNGIYTVTTVGSAGAPWVLTRATDYDNSIAGEVFAGDFSFIINGTTNAGQGWVMNSIGTSNQPQDAIKLGTDSLVWTQFTGVANITAGVALTKSGNTLNVNAATQSAPGYLSAADKTKIDALEMPISFHIAGTLTTGVKQPRFISPVACTLVNARAYAGGGSGVTYRLVKNGSTNGNTSATVGAAVVTTSLSTVTSLAVGDILQIEIVSAGTSGADLSVTIKATY